jgi:hypothetical protein
VLNWVVPKPKPVNGEAFNLKQDISQMTLVEQLNCINHAVVTGECSMEAADMVLGILLKSRQLLESSDFESRLRALENGDGFNV